MTRTFDILAHITVQHGYYNRKPFGGFRYVPAGGTADFMQRNDLLWIQKYGHTRLVAPSLRQAGGIYLHPSVNTPFSLLFWIENQEEHLENISRFPERGPAESILFSNRWQTESEPGTRSADTVVEWARADFRIPKAEWSNGTLANSYGETLIVPHTEQDDAVLLNVAGLNEDVYRWQSGTRTRYFCNADLGFRPKPLGLLHISAQPDLLDDGRLLSPDYRLLIEAAESFWQYRIPRQAIKKYAPESLSVEASDPSVNFTRQMPEAGNPYLCFTSSVPIRLEDSKSVRFRLKRVNTNGAPDSILLSDLPFPSPATFPSKEDGRITSPIYVNV